MMSGIHAKFASVRRAAAGALCLILAAPLAASEGAVSVYQPGFFDSMAGYMPDPGVYGDSKFLNYDGKVDDTFLDGQIATQVSSRVNVLMLGVTGVTKWEVFGGHYAWSIYANYSDVDVSARVSSGGQTVRDSDSQGDLGDVALTPVMIGWHSGNWHTMALLNIYLPTGSYDEDRLANTGLNRTAIEPMYNVTWLNEETGREFSAAMGYVFNSNNSDTDYQSGQEFHIDITAAQWLPNDWMFGATAYWFQQTTGDSGEGAILGGNKGRVLGAGPLAAYTATLGKETQVQFQAKYVWEFGGSNRMEGQALWLSAGMNF